jgi:hypothetical protein
MQPPLYTPAMVGAFMAISHGSSHLPGPCRAWYPRRHRPTRSSQLLPPQPKLPNLPANASNLSRFAPSTMTTWPLALVRHLEAACPPTYLLALLDPVYGYRPSTTLQTRTLIDRNRNMQRMLAPWSPPTSQECLFEWLGAGAQAEADGGTPIPDHQKDTASSTRQAYSNKAVENGACFQQPTERTPVLWPT